MGTKVIACHVQIYYSFLIEFIKFHVSVKIVFYPCYFFQNMFTRHVSCVIHKRNRIVPLVCSQWPNIIPVRRYNDWREFIFGDGYFRPGRNARTLEKDLEDA